ncbi:M24 family metallopeptidase [Tautonia sociabilis]|uniref:M24 family metallopeptidase n=1 Tax=Tautonia sociabilis TaxID=2080755 RepID=A0A432MNH0_9BACT|nr:M24 family metallopeptidase [Tautonia sociabilis]RUL88645.1 M24 family metallopeptidase [Tautonia sociabilis]
MFDLPAIQDALRQTGLDGWLLYDFRGSNLPARRVLDLAGKPVTSRRFFYAIPSEGPPRKLVHKIEPGALDHLPGEKTVYLRWQELEEGVRALIGGAKRVAMEYAPNLANPYIARVDAGVVEFVRSLGVEVESSGDLIQRFEASWTDEQWAMHQEATEHTTEAFTIAFGLIAERTSGGGSIRETEVQAVILDHFSRNGLTTSSPPIVGVGPHSGDPHYEPKAGADAEIRAGDFVLIDLWAKMDRPGAVYSDLTRVGFVGTEVPDRFESVFRVVARARDAAIARVREAFASGSPLRGFEVDDACRQVIEEAGYGHAFIHRTGHSIGEEVHGNGAHMDNLETHETRLVLPRTCFSIEPGIYLSEFGIRSEVDVFVDAGGQVHVTGGLQTRVLPILADPAASGR